MTTATVEATEATTDVTDEVEEVTDFTDFEYAVAEIDLATAGDADSDAMVEARKVYNTLNSKSKRTAKRWLKDLAEKALLNDDFAETKRLTLLNRSAAKSKTTSKGTGVSSRKSPEDKVIETYRVVHLAYQLVVQRAQAMGVDIAAQSPEGTDLSPAAAYADWIENGQEGDEPEADAELKSAARVSLGRGPKGQGRKPGSGKDETAEAEAAELADDE